MGRWVVNFLIREGYHVIASDLNKEELLRLRSALPSFKQGGAIKAEISIT